MSSDALAWAYRQAAPSTGAKFVLVALADLANHEHRAWPGQDKLARMTGQGVRTVVRHLQDLEHAGLVWRERRNEGFTKRLPDGFRLPVAVATSVGTPARMAPVNGTPAKLAHVPTPANTGMSEKDTCQIDTCQNGRISTKNKELTTSTPEIPARIDVEALCKRLADKIEGNGSKRPTVTQAWRDSARLLLDRDGRTQAQVEKAIDWCQTDDFWRSNILSMPTLRKQYDRLRLAALRDATPPRERLDPSEAAYRRNLR